MSMVDDQGYRNNVGIILINDAQQVFWGRRVGHDAWQFPQGGLSADEDGQQAMFRELKEEVGLEPEDVTILAETKDWIQYDLPKKYIRKHAKPMVIGQNQKWYLLQLNCSEQKIRLDLCPRPEFDSWRWVDYWLPAKEVIYFKQEVYQKVLEEFKSTVFTENNLKADNNINAENA